MKSFFSTLLDAPISKFGIPPYFGVAGIIHKRGDERFLSRLQCAGPLGFREDH